MLLSHGPPTATARRPEDDRAGPARLRHHLSAVDQHAEVAAISWSTTERNVGPPQPDGLMIETNRR